MSFIRHDLKKHFVMAIKSNRSAMPNRQRSCRNAPAFVAVSEKDKARGRFTRIDSLSWSSQKPVRGWLKGLDFSVLLHRQVFTNKDGSTGILYLACSDFDCNVSRLEAIYKKRWKVEVFHKTLKSHTGLAKSPTKCIRTQTNHIFYVDLCRIPTRMLEIEA